MNTRVVPQILPDAAITSSTGLPLGSLAFPAAGGVQAIDEAANVLYLSASDLPNDAALLSASQSFTGSNEFTQDIKLGAGVLFSGDYQISVQVPNTPTVSTAGSDYKIQIGGTGQIFLDAGATGSVQVGGNATCALGFYGHATVTQQTVSLGSGTLAADIANALSALGLLNVTP